ncbi:MAG: GNAT family N-acetyltransferase [Bacteroidetes bacterium]|nr:GNAT family N-acetyltransferase [Bacteroidota bacterium]
MSELFPIQYVNNREIDRTRWDACIKKATNGLIYAQSYYLDAMCPGWDALVAGDYETVMPLTKNKKWGISYLYQPFLTAQLGVFGQQISGDLLSAFVEKVSEKFKFIEINLNYGNNAGAAGPAFTERKNYVLSLSHPYEYLYGQYNENTRRNIKKAQQAGCSVQTDIDVEQLIALAVKQMKMQGHDPGENLSRFRTLYAFLHEKDQATTYGLFSPQNELLASAAFFTSHNRACYILVGNSPEARNTGASHALIDSFIREHAGRKLLLDFEGSDIPSLAQFYSSFGAVNEPYPALRINRLPFYLRWLKG